MKYTFNFTPVPEGLPVYDEPILLKAGGVIQNITFILRETSDGAGRFEPFYFDADDNNLVVTPNDNQAWAYIDEAQRVG